MVSKGSCLCFCFDVLALLIITDWLLFYEDINGIDDNYVSDQFYISTINEQYTLKIKSTMNISLVSKVISKNYQDKQIIFCEYDVHLVSHGTDILSSSHLDLSSTT